MSRPAVPANLKALTALRYPAAMWVTLYDYWPSLGLGSSPRVIANGYLGVDLFFVLSGFILSHVYLQSVGEGGFNYRTFLWARLARIYPLHLATLIGIGLMAGAGALLGLGQMNQVMVWESLPAQLLLAQAWALAPHGGWNHPAWSISAEWFAYLLFPAFGWAAWRLRTRPWMAMAGSLAALTAVLFIYQRLTGERMTDSPLIFGTLRIAPEFAFGCGVYLLWRKGAMKTRLVAKLAIALAAVLVVVASHLGAPEALLVAAFGLLILGLGSLTSTGSRLFSNPVGVYLGEVSFAVYMVCIPWKLAFSHGAAKLLGLSGDAMPPALWIVMVLGLTPAAMVVHHLVEKPARETMRGWAARRAGRKAAPVAGAVAASR